MMILQFIDRGNLRSVLSSNFNNILWKDKIRKLFSIIYDLKNLHELGYFHKDFHSGNILCSDDILLLFQILDYLDHQINKNQMIKYVEYCHILPQKF